MAQDIASELLNLILGELRSPMARGPDRVEKADVANCGLVCRNWLHSSRYILFADVHLSNRTAKLFLRATETSPFPLLTFIHSLRLISSEPSAEDVSSTIRAVLAPIYIFRTASFPNLFTLTLSGCRSSLGAVLEAISSCPELTTLKLHQVTLSYDDIFYEDTVKVFEFPPNWRKLILDMDEPDADVLFQHILSLDPVPILSSLSMHGWYPRDHSFVGMYLRLRRSLAQPPTRLQRSQFLHK
ncbi:hypothetical protein DFH07DRAFT_812609 [Mycena maculata]|uniref:F-box domain-containing protein n=1 Tax=Mycena maculata TaxID=230809 RepID=A0AAD7JFI7_9AGAR|nr:hypothetical protein DFH07DRAFT_812609 [Mycena maculata]